LKRVSIAVLVIAGALGGWAPVAAEPRPGAPAHSCGDQQVFAIHYIAHYEGASGTQNGLYVRAVPTRGGCASSWAQGDGQLSRSAIASQCRTGIEARFGPYPMTLRFAEDHVVRNRADCITVMSGVAHGEIDPGRAPLFPGGIPS